MTSQDHEEKPSSSNHCQLNCRSVDRASLGFLLVKVRTPRAFFGPRPQLALRVSSLSKSNMRAFMQEELAMNSQGFRPHRLRLANPRHQINLHRKLNLPLSPHEPTEIHGLHPLNPGPDQAYRRNSLILKPISFSRSRGL